MKHFKSNLFYMFLVLCLLVGNASAAENVFMLPIDPVTTATGNGNGATFIIASSDTIPKGQATADYICSSGVDCQNEINSAISALSSVGGKILILAGSYEISGSINITVPNVTLEGQGYATKIRLKNSMGAFNVININSVGYTTLSFFRIDGNKAGQTSQQAGIYATGATNTIISNLWIENTSDAGIVLDATSSKNLVLRNFITNVGKPTSGDGIKNLGSYNNISKNIVTGSGIYGINLGGSYSPVSANIVTGNGGGGIALGGSYISVAGNIVNSNTGNGIYGTAGLNTLTNNYIGSSSLSGINLSSAANNTAISQNILDNNALHGVYIDSAKGTVGSNLVVRNGASGVTLSSTADTNSVGQNYIANNSTYGLSVSSVYNPITLNYLLGNGTLTDKTYPNVYLVGSGNNFQFNMVKTGTNVKKPKYGITVDAASTSSIVTNNEVTAQTGGFYGGINNLVATTICTMPATTCSISTNMTGSNAVR